MIEAIVLAKKKTEFHVESILQDFAELPDPRSHINQLHLLEDMIVVEIVTVIAGAEGLKAIGVWAKSNQDRLADRLKLPNGISPHDTIGRVLMTIKLAWFKRFARSQLKQIDAKESIAMRRRMAG